MFGSIVLYQHYLIAIIGEPKAFQVTDLNNYGSRKKKHNKVTSSVQIRSDDLEIVRARMKAVKCWQNALQDTLGTATEKKDLWKYGKE